MTATCRSAAWRFAPTCSSTSRGYRPRPDPNILQSERRGAEIPPHLGGPPGGGQHVLDQRRGGRLAVGPGDADEACIGMPMPGPRDRGARHRTGSARPPPAPPSRRGAAPAGCAGCPGTAAAHRRDEAPSAGLRTVRPASSAARARGLAVVPGLDLRPPFASSAQRGRQPGAAEPDHGDARACGTA
jgi:hypothetical protein